MQGISTFSWYPRGVLGLQNLGPGVANGFITAGLPTRLVNGPGAKRVTKPVSNTFEFNPQTLKDAVGFRVSEPERIIHPNLKPTVNFSLPTTTKRLDPLNLREDINKDTDTLEGNDLLSKIVGYVMDLYKQGSSPFELSASPFQSLVSACKRLNLNPDPTLAGLPKTVDNRMPFGTFVKVNIWLLGADQVFDKQLKPGYIYIAQQKVPVSVLVSQNRPKAYVLDLYTRRASVGVPDASMADIAEGPRLPDVGQVPQGGPNLADGRDGRQEVANQDPVLPPEEEVKELLDVTAQAVNNAADLDAALLQLQRPQALRYSYGDEGEDELGFIRRDQEQAEARAEAVAQALEAKFDPNEITEADVDRALAEFDAEEARQAEALAAERADPITFSVSKTARYNGSMPRMGERSLDGVYGEIRSNHHNIFGPLFRRYKERKHTKQQLEDIVNSERDDGTFRFPYIRTLARAFNHRDEANGGFNNFIETLILIANNDPSSYGAYTYSTWNIKDLKNEASAVLRSNPDLMRELRRAVGTEDQQAAGAALNLLMGKDRDPAGKVTLYARRRSDYTVLELAESLLILDQTRGQIGVGKKTKKKPKKKRARPY